MDDVTVALTTIAREQQSGVSDVRRLVIRDEATWRAFWTEFVSSRAPAPTRPAVDFDRSMVLVATMGTQRSGGYAILIDRAYREDGALVAVVRTLTPGPACMTMQSLTSPADIVVVARSGLPVRFEELTDVQGCD